MRMADPNPDKCVKEAEKPHHDDEESEKHEPLADLEAELVRLRRQLSAVAVAERQATLVRAM